MEKTHCQLKGQPLQDEQHLRWLHRDRGTKVPEYSWTEVFQFSFPSIIWTYWAQVGDNRTSRSSKAFVASQTTESRGNASVEDRFKDDLWVDSIIESKARHSFPSGFAHCTVEDSVLDQAFLLCDVIIAMLLIIFWTTIIVFSKDSASNVIKAVLLHHQKHFYHLRVKVLVIARSHDWVVVHHDSVPWQTSSCKMIMKDKCSKSIVEDRATHSSSKKLMFVPNLFSPPSPNITKMLPPPCCWKLKVQKNPWSLWNG